MIELYQDTQREKGIVIRLMEECLTRDDYELWARKDYGAYIWMLKESRAYLANTDQGFAMMHRTQPAAPDEKNKFQIPYLCALFVTRDARKQGIGSALVKRVLDDAEGIGRVITSTPNYDALRIYNAQGFKIFDKSKDPDHKGRQRIRWYLERWV